TPDTTNAALPIVGPPSSGPANAPAASAAEGCSSLAGAARKTFAPRQIREGGLGLMQRFGFSSWPPRRWADAHPAYAGGGKLDLGALPGRERPGQIVELLLGLFFGVPVPLHELADEPVPSPGGGHEAVGREPVPLRLHLPLDVPPVAFDLVPVHGCP